MESYPGELLVGVFPLVFCVNATLESKKDDINVPSPPSPKGSSRSQFDKLLDTIAASSTMIDSGDIHDGGPLMQRVEEEQSDNEDEFLLNRTGRDGSEVHFIPSHKRRSSSSLRLERTPSGQQSQETPSKDRKDRKGPFSGKNSPFSKGVRFSGRGKKWRGNKRRGGGSYGKDSGADGDIKISQALAEALQQGQSFFQRARIVSTSSRHGFPPSKDPTGQSNRVIGLTGLQPGNRPPQKQTQKQIITRLELVTEKHPIDGILPNGWLEKHSAALPSVIVVVAQVHPPHHQVQQRQDDLLLEALENLQYSLAPKRKVDVKIVGLVQEGVSPIIAEQWSQGILGRLPAFLHNNNANKIDPETVVTLVHEKELRSDDQDSSSDLERSNSSSKSTGVETENTSALPRLHQSIRKSSLRYYKDRSRQVKEKLIRLGGPQVATDTSPLLLPLAIRYCFKVAVFYEFQWKQKKSLKYMLEAYRLVEIYYRYLMMLQHQTDFGYSSDDLESDHVQNSKANKFADGTLDHHSLPEISTVETSNSNDEVFDCGEGVEMSLPTNPSNSVTTATQSSYSDEYYSENPPKVAEDMVYQCRAVADWLNFKILQLCLVSHEKSGMIVASMQWQRHCRSFCCPRRSFLHTTAAPWVDWSYVSQQLLVVSQLLERYPPRSLGLLGSGEFDEDLSRCCPWRNYEAAADALLKAGHRIQLVQEQGGPSSQSILQVNDGDLRLRYVGGIDHEGFRPSFEDESKKDHTERALQCALRGIALYKKEVEQMGKTPTLLTWNRSGARLSYLAGGALVRLNRHSEAIPHLENALQLCTGWEHMKSIVRRLLITCHRSLDFSLGSKKSTTKGDTLSRTSFLLDSYFNSDLPVDELSSVLIKLVNSNNLDAVSSGVTTCIRWNSICIDDEKGASNFRPFTFALTFPYETQAMSGEKMKAHVYIKSNLKYPVSISNVSMLSALGPLVISEDDFPSISQNFLSLQPGQAIEFSSQILLPSSSDPLLVDEDGNKDDKKAIPVKDSNSTKPISLKSLSSGFTSYGGTQFLNSDENIKSEQYPVSQRLGGKPIRCEGMIVAFSLMTASQKEQLEIESTIKLKRPKCAPNVKRGALDENNYMSSVWARPSGLHLSRGPRCSRLFSPAANMIVTDLTSELTNGKALEGTVNRVVLELKAFDHQPCKEIMVRVKCSSALQTTEGEKRKILMDPGDSSADTEGVVATKYHGVRAPVLVMADSNAKNSSTEFGYELPDGWILHGDGQGEEVEYTMVASCLEANQKAYVHFDLYRPSCDLRNLDDEQVDESMKYNSWRCETVVSLSVQYCQESDTTGETTEDEGDSKTVLSLDHEVTVVWTSPISMELSSTTGKAYPCGIGHPSNLISKNPVSESSDISPLEDEVVLVENEKILTKGVIGAAAASDGLFVEVDRIQFFHSKSMNTHYKCNLLSEHNGDNTIYEKKIDNPYRVQSIGSKMSFAWVTGVNFENKSPEQSLTSHLGVVVVHWQPSPMGLSEEIESVSGNESIKNHGPLVLEKSPTIQFLGPLCYIERAPFRAQVEPVSGLLQVAVPFQVTYVLENNTSMIQGVEMLLDDAMSRSAEVDDSFLISGPVNKRITMGPYETHSVSYTAIPTKVGRVSLPPISISSARYNSWIVRESLQRRSVYVVP